MSVEFEEWWNGLTPAPYYPGIEKEIARHAWNSALASGWNKMEVPSTVWRYDGVMTVVYKGVTREVAEELMKHPGFSAGSWSHALEDRDRLHALLTRKGKNE